MEKRSKMPISDRARQFAPFASLKGYEECVKRKEEIAESKIEISDEKVKELSAVLKTLSKGDMVKAVYYSNGKYITLEGIISELDLTFKILKIIKTEISFSDIYDLEKIK